MRCLFAFLCASTAAGSSCMVFDDDCDVCLSSTDTRLNWASDCVYLSAPAGAGSGHKCQPEKWWTAQEAKYPSVSRVTSCGAPTPVPSPTPVLPPDAPVYFLEEAAEKKGAVCLDGSPGAYYFRPGSGDGSTKWYVHMEGGGWCLSAGDCAKRSKGNLGSSAAYPASYSAKQMAGQSGAMNTNVSVNPQMHNWNHVWIKYCDGNSFSGDNETTTVVDNITLHWRGSRVLDAAIDELITKHGMSQATEVVPGGGSAGGLATFIHCDRWQERLHEAAPGAKVSCLADCGFFLDCGEDCAQTTSKSLSYHQGFLWAYQQQNSSAGVDRTCLAHYQALGEGWKCNFAQYTASFNDAPLFARQALYDSWQTDNDLGSKDVQAINTWGADVLRLVTGSLLAQPQHGAFVDACHHHCSKWDQIRIEGDIVHAAFAKWYTDPNAKRLWLQNVSYPCDECCQPSASSMMI